MQAFISPAAVTSCNRPGRRGNRSRPFAAVQLAACALALPLMAAPSTARADGFSDATTTITPSGAAVLTIDPFQTFQASSDLQTSVPSTFGGANVANIIGANRFYTNGITGQGSIVANVEAGHFWGDVDGHETLTSRTSFVTGTGALGDFDRHATWVGMMIGGQNGGQFQGGYQTGIANGADLRSGAIATSWTPPAYSLSFSFSSTSIFSAYQAYFGTADAINSSWGFTDTTGTNFFTTGLDGLARANPRTTFVVSAGNSGPGTNTVGSPGSGYNAITVAALHNDGSNNYNSVASFSSRGPQDFGGPGITVTGVRAAVDIAAPGDSLTSAFYGGTTGGNTGGAAQDGTNLYSGGLAGTSFASPITAAAVTLLNSAARNTPAISGNANARDARVLKAVIQNSATKIPGWTNGQSTVNGVITTTQSLDYASGAGALNLNGAFDQFLSGGTKDVTGTGGGSITALGWDFGTVAAGSHNDYPFSVFLKGGTNLTLTLDWFRDRTFVSTSSTTDNAFRDLNLEVWNSTFTSEIATSDSLYNDVEHLSFTVPSDGLYAIRVSQAAPIFGATGPESYGLAWSGTATVPEPGAAAILLAVGGAALTFRRRN